MYCCCCCCCCLVFQPHHSFTLKVFENVTEEGMTRHINAVSSLSLSLSLSLPLSPYLSQSLTAVHGTTRRGSPSPAGEDGGLPLPQMQAVCCYGRFFSLFPLSLSPLSLSHTSLSLLSLSSPLSLSHFSLSLLSLSPSGIWR